MKPSDENIGVKHSRASSTVYNTRNTRKDALSKSNMLQVQNGKRAASSPKTNEEPSKKKRPAIGDITNAITSLQVKKKITKKSQPSKEISELKLKNKKNKVIAKSKGKVVGKENEAFFVDSSNETVVLKKEKTVKAAEKENQHEKAESLSPINLELSSSSFSVTTSQESSDACSEIFTSSLELAATTTVTTDKADLSLSQDIMTAEDRSDHPNSAVDGGKPEGVRIIDEDQDPCNACEYADSVFKNMKASEAEFKVRKYLGNGSLITPHMRAILIDWLVEIQENFELYHETLYLAVNIVDLYLQDQICSKDNLQLVGTTALFISCKMEERYPPPLDDFIYICDDIYKANEFREMEKKILTALGFRLHIPSSYRFLRRYGRIAGVTMETLTLARYILESTLTDYEFVDCSPSLLAASSLYLALKMKNVGEWDATLEYYSGYSETALLSTSRSLNEMIKAGPKPNVMNVRKKYSHPVFYKVAEVQPLNDI